jgi:hypothetical protein
MRILVLLVLLATLTGCGMAQYRPRNIDTYCITYDSPYVDYTYTECSDDEDD